MLIWNAGILLLRTLLFLISITTDITMDRSAAMTNITATGRCSISSELPLGLMRVSQQFASKAYPPYQRYSYSTRTHLKPAHSNERDQETLGMYIILTKAFTSITYMRRLHTRNRIMMTPMVSSSLVNNSQRTSIRIAAVLVILHKKTYLRFCVCFQKIACLSKYGTLPYMADICVDNQIFRQASAISSGVM